MCELSDILCAVGDTFNVIALEVSHLDGSNIIHTVLCWPKSSFVDFYNRLTEMQRMNVGTRTWDME